LRRWTLIQIAEIIQITQPKIYIILVKIFALDMLPATEVSFVYNEDELLEFKYYKKLMEERKGFRL
jgi:hypothetical protein